MVQKKTIPAKPFVCINVLQSPSLSQIFFTKMSPHLKSSTEKEKALLSPKINQTTTIESLLLNIES